MANAVDDLLGSAVPTTKLQVRRALELAAFLDSGVNPYARLQEARTGGVLEGETIVLQVDVEVGQLSPLDVHPCELVSVTFTEQDDEWPEVLAIRQDFPRLLHTNLRWFETPRSLCLYENRFIDSRSGWTTISIVERIRDWLRDSAAGVLHQSDQPIEQLYLVTPNRIILPSRFEKQLDADFQGLELHYFDRRPWGQLLLCKEAPAGVATTNQSGHVLLSFISPVVSQAAIQREPRSLADIQELYSAGERDFFAELRSKVVALEGTGPNLMAIPVVLISFPRSRQNGGEIERVERWAFLCDLSLGDLGEALGIWQLQEGIAAHLLGTELDAARTGVTRVTILNPSYMMSRQMAALVANTAFEDRAIAAIGMGALGSQVTALLARTGFGRWTLIDGDVLMPHNLVRHVSGGAGIGFPKVEVVRFLLDGFFETKTVDQTVFGEVLRGGGHTEALNAAVSSAELLIDFSASVAVQREISRLARPESRCVSCFLNPAGTELVVFVEDCDRRERLDALEMQYYRALIGDVRLAGHLPSEILSLRYARSCGDRTALMSTDDVAIFAGLAAKTIRNSLGRADSSITVHQIDTVGQVAYVTVPVDRVQQIAVGEWLVQFDATTLNKMVQMRKRACPTETGGIIVGIWDLDARTLYIIDALSAPSDSVKSEQAFVRGTAGLERLLGEIARKTAGVVRYVGEWHSHPDGFAANPSLEDLVLFDWLDERTQEMGFAPVMAILAEDQIRWICDGHTARLWFEAEALHTETLN